MPLCADLIQLLQRPSSSPSEQQEAAAALAALSMTPQVWSTAVGALPRLVALMQHPDSTEDVREQAKRALHHVTDYACLPLGIQVQDASASDLVSLVRLLHGDVGFVQSAVLFTLRTLALNSYNRSQIIQAGAIGRIVQLLKSKSQEVQLSAVGALSCLSRERNNQALFLSAEGAVASLTRLLKSSSATVQCTAVATLSNIATDADGAAAVGAAGTIPPLIHLLKSKSVFVQSEAAKALGNLGSNEANERHWATSALLLPWLPGSPQQGPYNR